MDNEFSCDLDKMCPICRNMMSSTDGQPCSEACYRRLEADIDAMYQSELECRENALQRQQPQVRL